MAKISTYPLSDLPLNLSDILIGTEVGGPIPNATKNFSLGQLQTFINSAVDLQLVLDNGNAATQNINLTGTVNAVSLILSGVAQIPIVEAGDVEITNVLKDNSGLAGTNGQVLTSTGLGLLWQNLPVIDLQDVLDNGNSATQDINLTGTITTDYLEINNEILDNLGNPGTLGQVLTSTGTGIVWATPGPGLGQTLDQTLSFGNTSGYSIRIQASGGNDAVVVENVSPTPGIPDGRVTISSSLTIFQINDDNFSWSNISGQTIVGHYPSSTFSNNIYFPNNSGTLLVEVNGLSGLLSGSISIDLDSVLNQGNTSSNEIVLSNWFRTENGIKIQDNHNSTYFTLTTQPVSGSGITSALQLFYDITPTYPIFEFSPGGLWMTKSIGLSTVTTVMSMNNITASRGYDLPDATGTLALSVNGVFADAQGNITLPTGGASWLLAGNAGTTPGTDFIGTTDAQDLVFKVNNVEYLRLNSVTGNNNEIALLKNVKLTGTNSQIWVSDTATGGYITINANAADRGTITFAKDLSNRIIIKGSNITGTSNVLQLPNATGTLALSVNGVTPNAAGDITLPIGTNFWSLTGNAGTTPGTNFIGTTDLQDVIFKANGVERLKIDATAGDVYTPNSFRANGSASGGTSVQAFSTIGNGGVIIAQDPTDKGYIYIANSVGDATIKSTNLSASRTIQIPDATGTFVLSVNGTAPNAAGNVTLPAPSVPNLSQVTAVGNTTSDDITISSGASSSNGFTASSTSGNGTSRIGFSNIWKGYLLLNNGSFSGILRSDNLTASRTAIQLPNNDGTLVLSVNGVTPNAAGDVTLPSAPSAWLLGGNSGTTPGTTNILGTNDLVNLVFKANNINRMSIDAASGDIFATTSFRANANTDTSVQAFSTIGNGGVIIAQDSVDKGYIYIANSVGNATIKSANLSGSRTIQIPDANGTFALSVNGIAANASGDIIVPGITTPTLQQVLDTGNTTTTDIILSDASIQGIDTLEFDLTPATTTHAEGRVHWNDNLKTLQVDTENAGVQVNLGHETIQRVRNVTGSPILKGTIVYINGESGGRPTVIAADNSSDATSAQTIGWVIADIPNNNNGYVITNGLLDGINTTGFASGTQLYLGSSGGFTSTFPVQPLHNVRVGIVINGNSATGSVFVNILNGYELEELHDVLISTPLNDQVLTYETSSGLWKNKYPLPTQTGNNGKFLFTNGTSASWSFPSRSFKLGFNNISDYVVNNGSGTQNFGVNTLGMFIAFDLQSALYGIVGTDYVFKIKVVTHEQYGGVTCSIGVRTIHASTGGNVAFDTLQTATYVAQTGTNYALQTVDLTINVPITTSGQPTDFFKFEVIMNRSGSAGSTSVIGSTLVFSV